MFVAGSWVPGRWHDVHPRPRRLDCNGANYAVSRRADLDGRISIGWPRSAQPEVRCNGGVLGQQHFEMILWPEIYRRYIATTIRFSSLTQVLCDQRWVQHIAAGRLVAVVVLWARVRRR